MKEWGIKNYYKTNVDVASKIFEEIEQRDGALTPEAVVEEARSEDSPLHNDFEWDDTVAANKYRLEQARKMISLVIEVSDASKPPVRAYVNTNCGVEKGRYMSIGKVIENEDLWSVVLSNARRELEVFNSKYKKYDTFGKLSGAIDEFLRETA